MPKFSWKVSTEVRRIDLEKTLNHIEEQGFNVQQVFSLAPDSAPLSEWRFVAIGKLEVAAHASAPSGVPDLSKPKSDFEPS